MHKPCTSRDYAILAPVCDINLVIVGKERATGMSKIIHSYVILLLPMAMLL